MSEKVENKQLSRHKEWMQETCPQTYNALYAETDGDSEDLKSCCLRLEQEVYLLERQLAEAREVLNIDIGDFIMVDDKMHFVTGIVSEPVLRVYYYEDDVECVALERDIDCHFLNMNRYKEQLKEKGEE